MSGDRGSSRRGRKRKHSAAGCPRKNNTPSVADSSREGAGTAGRDNSLSGDPSSLAGHAGRTPASAVQPPSSGGSSSAGAAAINPVRRSSRTNVAFATPGGLTSGSARGSSEHSSGTARAPSIRDNALHASQSTGVRGNARYQIGYFADTQAAQRRRRGGVKTPSRRLPELLVTVVASSTVRIIPG